MPSYDQSNVQNSANPTVNSDDQKCEISAQVPPQRISRSKDELAYWKAAIRRIPESPYWYAEIQRDQIRRKVSLETSNKAAAAKRARTIWHHVRALGWPGYLAKFKPESLPNPDPSIGDFLAAVERTADLSPKTLRAYRAALQKIIGDIEGLSSDKRKFAAGGKSRKAWLGKLHAVRLSVLTPEAVQEWKRSFLATAGQDPLSQRSAKVSVNSFLRCARSLFSPRIIKHLKLEMPDPLPFADAQFEPRPSTKYRSTFDIAELVRSATEELVHDTEAYKVFLLSSMAGLRRKEIDLLEWSAFRWDDGAIRIETTEHFSAKSEDSLGDVAVEPQVLELFRGWCAQASGPFVIESPEPPRPELLHNYYRAETVFTRLIGWLRSKGVRSLKPLHCLRKEFGSEVCKHAGIYAASRALRHSDIKVTCQFYVQDRTRAVSGLGHLLGDHKVIEFKREVA